MEKQDKHEFNSLYIDEQRKKYEQEKAELIPMITPIIEWMQKNYHPHVRLIIESNGCELVEGVLNVQMWSEDENTSHI